jgi:hypothetical protein
LEHAAKKPSVTVGAAEAGCEVELTIETAATGAAADQDYQEFLRGTAGGWQGDFERLPQVITRRGTPSDDREMQRGHSACRLLDHAFRIGNDPNGTSPEWHFHSLSTIRVCVFPIT